MTLLISESLDFRFYFLNSNLRSHYNCFYIFSYAAEGQQEQIILLKCFINSSKTIFLLTANGTQDLSSIENLTFKDMETCAKVKSGCQNTEGVQIFRQTWLSIRNKRYLFPTEI